MFIDNYTILPYHEIGLLSEGLVMIEQTGIANTIDTVEQEADVMCNLGQGIREKAVIETTATIVMNIMNNEHLYNENSIESLSPF